MHKTLLLCFIHGFKGDDNTFRGFPEHLRALTSHALPKLKIAVAVYPQFETRGDLGECVIRFSEWLQNRVIDLEVAAETPSPTIDPSVHTILIGHSMGGIVAAETVIKLANEQPISQSTDTHGFMFPYIQAVLAFDTPYLGVSPGVVAHGAEGHYNTATSTLTQLSGLTGGLWGAKVASDHQSNGSKKPVGALPAPPATDSKSKPDGAAAIQRDGDAAATPTWQRWGKVAMFAGAAGALAAGGAAAYLKRDQITESWGWVGSHLEFVGCLMKGEDMKKRMQSIQELEDERGLGFANLYTVLGKGATGRKSDTRTFVSLPRSALLNRWEGMVNDATKDEIGAHLSMFFARDNPGYYALAERAKTLIVGWIGNDWYDSAVSDPRPDSKAGRADKEPDIVVVGGETWEETPEDWAKGDEDDGRWSSPEPVSLEAAEWSGVERGDSASISAVVEQQQQQQQQQRKAM
ncbi:MAG: hypothetical protein M1825_001959 [Sarcosagium campestre]|nr:MAG: hypothetical protein M1825_001959 [Sarcosagium campestre]